jgi:hypothetical protein
MKKPFISLVVAIAASFSMSATTHTVSNNSGLPGSPGQYLTVTAAISAASNGDTILVQPSSATYPGFSINKSLVIIGAGYNPQTTNNLSSRISSTIEFSNGSSNSKLIGLLINANITWTNTFPVSNFTIERCHIGYMSMGDAGNVLVERNIIDGTLTIGYNNGCIIRNNILRNAIIDYYNDPISVAIKNNIFLCQGTPLAGMKNDLIENNIFYGSFPAPGDNNQTCTFNNNYVFGSSTFPYGTNIGSGNITNTNATFPSYVCGQTFAYTSDLRPVGGHACINGGTDGTDIGITGGASPFYIYPAPYPMTGEPKIPQIREIVIPVSSVPSGGTLNINVKARKRD